MSDGKILLSNNGKTLEIDKAVYVRLFDDSIVYGLQEYLHTLENNRVSMSTFLDLSRKAQIPYALFFAPKETIEYQIHRKQSILLSGASKDVFSVNSRGAVKLKDIELIVKDIIRKQTFLKKHDSSLSPNSIIGMLKRSRDSVTDQATALREALGIDLDYISALTKTKTFEYLIAQVEVHGIFVSQSARAYMPQNIQNSVRFSGICIKDKCAPFIFLNNRDESETFEPEGRRILTLVLLCVCLAKSKFKPLSYDEKTKELIENIDYQIAEEVLMPRSRLKGISISNLDELKQWSNHFSVTPSAFMMRMFRDGRLSQDEVNQYSKILREEFDLLPARTGRAMLPENAFKKYSGVSYSKAVFGLLDAGKIDRSEARKILFLNKEAAQFLETYRSKL